MSICEKYGNYNFMKSFTFVQIEQLKKKYYSEKLHGY